ncbi:MAG: 50S ribosomal protein L3 [Eubacteriaceae bacterium]|nr:50S ribosomal protein L3 [Eubacteriaceae bacterium]
MKKAIIGTKMGMTQVFKEDGTMVPVTVIKAGPCAVVQLKTIENDGYAAVQLGFEDKKENNANKCEKGHFAKSGVAPKKVVKEMKFENAAEYNLADEVKVDIFQVGDRVDITGTSKGKGYQGGIKRHGFARGPMAHGSKYHRASGSMGSSATPSHVLKGKKLPGQMGNERSTMLNLEVVVVDTDKNVLLVKGAVPGIRGSVVTVRETVK